MYGVVCMGKFFADTLEANKTNKNINKFFDKNILLP
jgi:hypothetical protein